MRSVYQLFFIFFLSSLSSYPLLFPSLSLCAGEATLGELMPVPVVPMQRSSAGSACTGELTLRSPHRDLTCLRGDRVPGAGPELSVVARLAIPRFSSWSTATPSRAWSSSTPPRRCASPPEPCSTQERCVLFTPLTRSGSRPTWPRPRPLDLEAYLGIILKWDIRVPSRL